MNILPIMATLSCFLSQNPQNTEWKKGRRSRAHGNIEAYRDTELQDYSDYVHVKFSLTMFDSGRYWFYKDWLPSPLVHCVLKDFPSRPQKPLKGNKFSTKYIYVERWSWTSPVDSLSKFELDTTCEWSPASHSAIPPPQTKRLLTLH